jgi:glycerol-3-phosphate acyltransferase PlsY
MNAIFTACCLAYIIGSIPFGLILGKVFGAGDIRTIGSGNIGATNMLRTGRKGLAAATLALDFIKGALAVCAAQGLTNWYFSFQGHDFVIAPYIGYLAGAAAVLGHVFPVWLDFKGGKGVATTLGVFYATQPLIGMLTTGGWLLIFYLSRVSSLAAIGSLAASPVLGYLYATPHFALMALALTLIVIYRHKDNIARLRAGTEISLEKDHDPT